MLAEEEKAEVVEARAGVERRVWEIMTAIGVHLGSTSACVAVFKVRFPASRSSADAIKKVAHYCL